MFVGDHGLYLNHGQGATEAVAGFCEDLQIKSWHFEYARVGLLSSVA